MPKIYFAILSVCFLAFTGCQKAPLPTKKEKSIFVKFKPVVKGPISSSFSTSGEIKAHEDVMVLAQRPGRVLNIFVKEGQYVQRGATLVELQGTDVDADLARASQEYKSYQKLYQEGAISQIELANYKATVDKLLSYKNDLVIKAETSGQVGEIIADRGEYVKEGNEILNLVKLYPLELTYTIPERLLAKVKPGQRVQFSTDAYPGYKFDAVINFIAPRVDPATRATLVRAQVAPSNKILKANQFVLVEQNLATNSNFVLVPEEAIYLDQGQQYVFTAAAIEKTQEEIEADKEKAKLPGPPPATHIAKRNKVETGLRKPGFVQIISGIDEGDNVVYAGLTSIYDGAKLVQVADDK